MGHNDRLELTEDEAYALLSLCLTSDMTLDHQSELAMQKLAEFCKNYKNIPSNNIKPIASGFCEAV